MVYVCVTIYGIMLEIEMTDQHMSYTGAQLAKTSEIIVTLMKYCTSYDVPQLL